MKRLSSFALLGAFSVGSLLAQTASETIIDRVQQPTTPPPAPAAPRAEKETGDLDGGVQRLAETRARPFKLTVGYDLQTYYTDNVFLAAEDEIESVIVANTLQARADFDSRTVGSTLLTPSIGVVYQRYNHALGTGDDAREDLDFDAYTVPLNLRVRFGDNWEANFGVTANAVFSLEGPPSYTLTYKSLTPSASIRKLVGLGRARILSYGASVSYAVTDSDVPAGLYRDDRNDKADYTIDAGYYYVTGPWVLGPYARLTYSDYAHYQEAFGADVDRKDIVGSIGFSAGYTLNSRVSARAFTSFDWRNPQGDSSVDYGYKTVNLGLGLSLMASF